MSFLEGNGVPSMVERATIRPPSGRLGPVTPEERRRVIAHSPVKGKYDRAIDSESAHEMLRARVEDEAAAAGPAITGGSGGLLGGLGAALGRLLGTTRARGTRLSTGQMVAREVTRTVGNRVAGQIAADFGKQVLGTTGSTIGRAVVRGTLGGILRR